MSALPKHVVDWFAMASGQKLEVCETALRGLSSDPDDIAEAEEQDALDRVADAAVGDGSVIKVFAELHASRHALDYIASRIDLPYYHAKAFRELLARLKWLERAVEAEL
jgi:hypothetical protein